MKIKDVLEEQHDDPFNIIRKRCSEFVSECSLPLFRNLPNITEDVRKVKVRYKKPKHDTVADAFNQAFINEKINLRQKAIFANGEGSFDMVESNPFYILPINGFKFMYSKEVHNSSKDYRDTFGSMVEQFGCDQKPVELLKDVLKYTYTNENLEEGVSEGAEIIIYNIPYYYAVKSSYIEYDELLTKLR